MVDNNKMKSYFRIGEISSLFDIPMQTLRYYDKIGIFSPAYTNQETGYRYYAMCQLPQLHQIKIFKSMGISASNVNELMLMGWDVHKLDEVYTTQLKQLDKKIEEIQTLQRELNEKRNHFLTIKSQPKNKIFVKQCKAREIFSKPINPLTNKEQDIEYYRVFLSFSNEISYINVAPGFTVSQSLFLNERTNASSIFLVNPTIVPEGFYSQHIAEGTYLSILIEDNYEKAPFYYDLLRQYIDEKAVEVIGDIYEFCYTIMPIYIKNESLWELQVRINPLTLQSL